jgi:hypothetical protein
MPEREIRQLGSPRPNTGKTETLNDGGRGGMGNSATQALLVEGALGRVFNRISGVSESNTASEGVSFNASDLKRYLEEQLTFAEGEWFRGTKIDGVAEKIMENLDSESSGDVTWLEFQVMIEEMRGHLVGDVSAGASSSEIQARAREVFASINGGGESVGFGDIEACIDKKLPAETDHKGLIAQLGALMVLDIVDLDQTDMPVRERDISEREWMTAAKDFSR